MNYFLFLIGLVASIWLISDNDPGSFFFLWGVFFGVINAAGIVLKGVRDA